MKWKTMTGHVLEFHEMSDKHLKNAFKYSQQLNKPTGNLYQEAERRHNDKFFLSQTKCQSCGDKMNLIVYEYDDVGWGFDKYRYECSCGTCSPWIERNNFNVEDWLNE